MSKVAMAACAVLVLAVLSGLYSDDMFRDPEGELKQVVRDFCATADRIARSGAEFAIEWRVPYLSTGEVVEMTVKAGLVHGSAGDALVVDQALCPLTTHVPAGPEVNASSPAALQASSPPLVLRSGENAQLTSLEVNDGGVSVVFVLVSRAS